VISFVPNQNKQQYLIIFEGNLDEERKKITYMKAEIPAHNAC
jgi:hypothetical protein